MTRQLRTLPEPDLPLVNLAQGDVFWSVEPTLVTTLLGSCVAVCLWDIERGIGGMNHFVLPHDRHNAHNARFAPAAMQQLLNGLLHSGAHLSALRAKVFGGASVLRVGPNGANIGTENVRAALASLHAHGIPVLARRTGGHRGVAIRFVTSTGEVLARPLNGSPATN